MNQNLFFQTLAHTRKTLVPVNFSEKLKELFDSNSNFMQKELADYARVTPSLVSNWVTGKKQPNLTNLYAILEFFINKGIEPIEVFFQQCLGVISAG